MSSNWDVSTFGFDHFLIADQGGNSTDAMTGAVGVPGVEGGPSGDLVDVTFPVGVDYNIRLHADQMDGFVDIQLKSGVTRLAVVRYNNVALITNHWLSFDLCTDGPSALESDLGAITPTADVRGPAAADETGPDVNLTSAGDTVTITATDPSGILQIRYSIDMGPSQIYSGPFQVPCGRDVIVEGLAEDTVGNQSPPVSLTVHC